MHLPTQACSLVVFLIGVVLMFISGEEDIPILMHAGYQVIIASILLLGFAKLIGVLEEIRDQTKNKES